MLEGTPSQIVRSCQRDKIAAGRVSSFLQTINLAFVKIEIKLKKKKGRERL